MQKLLATLLLMLIGPQGQSAQEGRPSIVLPNPNLLTCKGADCSGLWSKESEHNTVFPKQLAIDTEQGCVYGMTAWYERSISVDDLKAAIDAQYGKWVLRGSDKSPMMVWRVEPERLAIQLAVSDKRDEKRGVEAGTKEVIFIAFGGRAACAH